MLDYPGEETGERPQCDLLLQRYCAALKRHGKVGFIASAFPELLPARARELLHGEGVAALQGVEDGLAAWGRIARYRQRRAALLERGEAALVPICPGPLAGDGYLLDEWQSKQALKPFGLQMCIRDRLHPGRRRRDPPLRRNRPGPGDQQAAGGSAGGTDRRGKPGRPGQHVLVRDRAGAGELVRRDAAGGIGVCAGGCLLYTSTRTMPSPDQMA